MKLSKYLLSIIIISVVMLGIVPVCKAAEDGGAIGQADKGWFSLKNVSGNTIYYGDVVWYASATTVNYGDDVRLGSPATTLVAGVVLDNKIEDGTIGRILVRGYHPAVRLTHKGCTVGDQLIPSGWALESTDTTTSNTANFIALDTVAAVSNQGRISNDDTDVTSATPPTVKCLINLR